MIHGKASSGRPRKNEKAIQNPAFVRSLVQKIEPMDFSAYNKKRRLPQVDHLQPVYSSEA